jgi:hypothetical protein
MKFSARTTQVLRNFSSINPSIQFNKGTTLRTISPNKTMMAKAKLADNIEGDFAIYDLSRLLGVTSMFQDPTFKLEERKVRIESEGRTVSYTYADPSTIVVPPNKDINIDSFDVEFDLTQENLAEIMKAIGILGLPELAVVGEDGNILLRAMDTKNPSSDKYDITVGETDKEFVAVFKTDNLKLLSDNYKVGISSKSIAHFESTDIEYWVSIESNSTFN